LIPLKDNLPTDRFPILTVLLIVLNVVVFVWQTQFPTSGELERVGLTSGIDQSALEYGAIPYRVTHPGESECFLGTVPTGQQQVGQEIVCEGTPELRAAEGIVGEPLRDATGATTTVPEPVPLDQAAWWATVFTSMFMHGGILHLAGNMLFLWVFGNNIEDSMGRPRFLLFYLLAGITAVYAQSLVDTSSTVPTIGASGAVAGVLGGYALLHPQARVLTLIFLVFFISVIEIPAVILLGIWFVLQFLPALGQTAVTDLAGGDGVAYLAHVGGFIFGLAAIKLFANRYRERPTDPRYPVY
jgi:membrane associated rhomboid family serine protease